MPLPPAAKKVFPEAIFPILKPFVAFWSGTGHRGKKVLGQTGRRIGFPQNKKAKNQNKG